MNLEEFVTHVSDQIIEAGKNGIKQGKPAPSYTSLKNSQVVTFVEKQLKPMKLKKAVIDSIIEKICIRAGACFSDEKKPSGFSFEIDPRLSIDETRRKIAEQLNKK